MMNRTMYNTKGEIVTHEEYQKMTALEKADVICATNKHYKTKSVNTINTIYGHKRNYNYVR